MKNLIVALLLLLPGVAGAELSINLGRGYSIGLSTSLGDTYTVGARDWYNGQWLAGYGKEIFPFKRNGKEFAYIGGQHLFNADEGGMGAVGPTLGIKAATFGAALQFAVDKLTGEGLPLPKWAHIIGNWVSLEFGYSFRIASNPQGVSRHVATVGGQVRIPLDLIRGL